MVQQQQEVVAGDPGYIAANAQSIIDQDIAGGGSPESGAPNPNKPKKSKESRARSSRKRAIQRMIETWQTGYDMSRRQYRGAQQNILAAGQSNRGAVTASLAGSGLTNTTASAVGQRAVGMDTNRSLQQLGQAQAQTEYGKWMDLTQLKGLTKWDRTQFNTAMQQNQSGWDMAMQLASVGVGAATAYSIGQD